MMRPTVRGAILTVLAVGLVLGTGATAASARHDAPLPELNDSVDIAVTPDGVNWWVAEADGQVTTALLDDRHLTCQPPAAGDVRSIDRSSSGEGYWLVTAHGQVIACGDAGHFGDLDTEGITPNAPIVGIAGTSDGGGYWLAGGDGGVFSYGNASFEGSAGAVDLVEPVIGIESSGGDDGYWLVATDGGVFTYGDADFHGSAGGIELNQPMIDMTRSPSGGGYYLLGEDGGIFAYGDATFRGSRYTLDGGRPPSLTAAPFVGIDYAWSRDGYFIADSEGTVRSFLARSPGEASGEGPSQQLLVHLPRLAGGECTNVEPVQRDVEAGRAATTAALEELFAGPTEQEEREGLGGPFGEATEGTLRAVHVGDSIAYVDLRSSVLHVDNLSTACLGAAFLAAVKSTLTQFTAVEDIRFAVEGDPSVFYNFMQIGCPAKDEAGDRCDPEPFARFATSAHELIERRGATGACCGMTPARSALNRSVRPWPK